MIAGPMLRLRRRRNYILAVAAVLIITTYITLLQRDDLLTRIMTTPEGSLTSVPKAKAILPLPPSDPEASQKLIAEIPMSYSTAARPAFADLSAPPIADLPHKFLPSGARRLVIIGDVHGQLSSLHALLRKVEFKKETDHLVFTGDMVSKGPDSAGVVQLAMDLGASAVRGNHEDRVLLAHKQTMGKASSAKGWLDSILGTADEVSSDTTAPPSPGTEADVAVASKLSRAQLKYLAGLPIILRLGPLASASRKPWNAGTIAVVHAGLVPGVALEKQDLRAAMNMRTLVYPAEAVRRDNVRRQLEDDERKRQEEKKKALKEQGKEFEVKVDVRDEQVDAEMERLRTELGFEDSVDRRVWFPVDGREGEPWSEVWSAYQSGIEAEGDRTVVVYGHDAKAGLRVKEEVEEVRGQVLAGGGKGKKGHKVGRYAFGLDSGCVYGRQLSALVLEVGRDGGVRHRVVQVECEKAAAKEPP
jgi:hypothetical protein